MTKEQAKKMCMTGIISVQYAKRLGAEFTEFETLTMQLYHEYCKARKEYKKAPRPNPFAFLHAEDCDDVYQSSLEASWELRDRRDAMEELYKSFSDVLLLGECLQHGAIHEVVVHIDNGEDTAWTRFDLSDIDAPFRWINKFSSINVRIETDLMSINFYYDNH